MFLSGYLRKLVTSKYTATFSVPNLTQFQKGKKDLTVKPAAPRQHARHMTELAFPQNRVLLHLLEWFHSHQGLQYVSLFLRM